MANCLRLAEHLYKVPVFVLSRLTLLSDANEQPFPQTITSHHKQQSSFRQTMWLKHFNSCLDGQKNRL